MDRLEKVLETMSAHDPCEETGKPCEWHSEERYDEDGEMVSWDDLCFDCGQWRDWTKDLCPEPK